MERRSLLITEVRPRFKGFGPWKLAPQVTRADRQFVLAEDPADARRQIREHVPLEPGVYAMIDADGALVYVGQSHALRDRLLSYIGTAAVDKAQRIIAHTHRLIWETVPDAFAAPLRELELIRRWRPRFNVRGQPGRKRAAYVVVGHAPAAYAYLTSQPRRNDKSVFGPLRATRLARRAVDLLNDCFQLRNCGPRVLMQFTDDPQLFSDACDNASPGSAHCLRYVLGTCLGPCAGFTSHVQYASQVAAMQRFLQGDDCQSLERMRSEMLQAAQQRRYEHAGAIRDVLRALEYLRDQIARLRDARRNYRFVYPLTGSSGRTTWYFIHRGQVIGAAGEPRSARANAACHEMLARLEDACVGSVNDDADDDFEMQWLVSFWFRRHPDALTKTMSPAAARRTLGRFSRRHN